MMRTVLKGLSALVIVATSATAASAQVVQSFQVGFGGFSPRGFDGRAAGDVLIENLTTFEPLLFDIGDFKGANIFGEWAGAFGHHVEVAIGAGYYQRTAPSIYAFVIDDRTGRDIEQDLKLRIAPVTGLVRFLPFGRMGDVQPYVGAGISALNFRYSEVGQFVDTSDYSIFEDRFIATGTTVGPVVLGGLRIPIKGDIYGLNLEWRYQFGEGNLGSNSGFLTDKIDLSGGMFNVGFMVRF